MINIVRVMFALCLGAFWPGSDMLAKEILSSTEIKEAVDSLVSPNKAPFGMNPGPASGPQDYDEAAQQVIQEKLLVLTRAGEKAIPMLINHIDDDRYCLTELHYSGYCNRTVGDMCLRIIRSHIDGPIQRFNRFTKHKNDPEGRSSRPSYVDLLYAKQILGTKEKWGKWWQSNNNDLAQIQLKALNWAISEERNRGFSSVLEEAQVLAPLEWLQISITKTGKPLPCSEQEVVDYIKVSPVTKEPILNTAPNSPAAPPPPMIK